MKRERLLCVTVGAVLALGISAGAQERGIWRAANSTSQSITGDVALSADKLSINFAGFPMARIRDLTPDEVSAVFDMDRSSVAQGSLYRLSIPGSKRFLHKNTLCGSEDVQWMATYAAGNYLHLAFISGSKMPVLSAEALANSTDLCGTFTYAR